MKKLAVLLLTFSVAIMSACSDENKTTETDKTNSQEKQKSLLVAMEAMLIFGNLSLNLRQLKMRD